MYKYSFVRIADSVARILLRWTVQVTLHSFSSSKEKSTQRSWGELDIISKNNLRGITLGMTPIWDMGEKLFYSSSALGQVSFEPIRARVLTPVLVLFPGAGLITRPC